MSTTLVAGVGGGSSSSSSSSSSTSSATGTAVASQSGAINSGAMAGGIVGGLVGLAILIIIVVLFVRRSRRKARLENWNASQFRRSAMIMDDDPMQPPPPMAQRNDYANSVYDNDGNLAGAGAFRTPPSNPYAGGYQDAVRQPAYPFGGASGNAAVYDPSRPSVEGAAMVSQMHSAYLPSPYDGQPQQTYHEPAHAYSPDMQYHGGAHPIRGGVEPRPKSANVEDAYGGI